MALVTVKLAASGAPCSLRNVPLTSTSIFGIVYGARPVTRVVKPEDVVAIREHRAGVDVAWSAGVGRRDVVQLRVHVPDAAQVAHGLPGVAGRPASSGRSAGRAVTFSRTPL